MSLVIKILTALIFISFISLSSFAGNIISRSIDSKIMNEKRVVSIYLPDSYSKSSKNYPVILLLDGEYYFKNTISAVEFLSSSGSIPDCIIIGIQNTERERDLTPPFYTISNLPKVKQADLFLKFLTEEVHQLLTKEYRINDFSILMGHSSGGLFTLYALSASNYFDWFISMDAPVHLEEYLIEKKLSESFHNKQKSNQRLVLIENKYGWLERWNYAKAIFPEEMFVHHSINKSESHQMMVYKSTYDALKQIFHDFAPELSQLSNAEEVNRHYSKLSSEYEFEVSPSFAILRQKISDFIYERKYDDAKELYKQLVENYGTSSSSEEIKGKIEKIKDEKLEETIEYLANLPLPKTTEMEKFNGIWSGEYYSEGGTSSKFEVHLNGTDKGFVKLTFPNGKENKQENILLRIIDENTIEFGYMNMMRPKGILAYKGTLVDENRIEGQMKLKGLKFEPPGGRKLPEIFFYLVKKG